MNQISLHPSLSDNVRAQLGLLIKFAPPAISATRQIALLNVRMAKEIAARTGEAWRSAVFESDAQPISTLLSQMGSPTSRLATEYSVALSQIMVGTGTQMMINASWLTSEPKTQLALTDSASLDAEFPAEDTPTVCSRI